MLIFITLLFFIAALLFFGSGIRLIVAPVEDLWAVHARKLQAQGQTPQRSMAWERQIYLRGALCVVIGIICLALFFLGLLGALQAAKRLPKLSSALISGRRLAQKEGARRFPNDVDGLIKYAPRK